jgi:serine/threonine protein kinase
MNTQTRRKHQSSKNVTRKLSSFEKLNKCPRSRITGMESYKINCGKNLLLGYKTIKASEETSMHKDDFVHVVLSKLKDYKDPVVVKVYDQDNFHLHIELKILQKINGYRNTAHLICEFTCDDDKNKYNTKIIKQIQFCGNGSNKLHFFVYEYIAHGDVSDYLMKNQESHIVKSIILQIVCIIMQLASIYNMCHGDINSGNILIDTTNEKTLDYCIEGQTFIIESYGIIPKIIDYGRSHFYKEAISNSEVWFDVILALGVIYPYIQDNKLKKVVLDISKKEDIQKESLKDYYVFLSNELLS